MGRKKYAAEMLKYTVESGHKVLAVVTDTHVYQSPTAAMAEKLNIPVVSPQEAEKIVKSSDSIDLVISYLYWMKINPPLIDSPRYGCINFHPAILPDWKGVGGYNIAILSKLNEWGASAHYVDSSIDTGEIIRVFRFSFDYRFETAMSLEQKTQIIQMDLYKSVLQDVSIHGKLDSIPNTGGQYISKAQMLEMMKIDPILDDIDTKIQAFWFPPCSGAYIEINGIKYTLVNELILKQIGDQLREK